jgi:aryl-alcohol dehydrogenase-like predicted oxidoreductase
MRQVRLGRTELKVSAVALGTWSFGGDWGPADVEDSRAVIHRALELGITLFDTAQGYGFGAAARSTRSSPTPPPCGVRIRKACEPGG